MCCKENSCGNVDAHTFFVHTYKIQIDHDHPHIALLQTYLMCMNNMQCVVW